MKSADNEDFRVTTFDSYCKLDTILLRLQTTRLFICSLAKGKRKARSIRPGLNILKHIQLNRGTRCDYERDWQVLSDRQLHHRNSISMHQKHEQNRNISQRTYGLCTWDTSSVLPPHLINYKYVIFIYCIYSDRHYTRRAN